MSAVAFGNRGGWQRWRLMDDERRQHEEARTFRAVTEMLEEENRVDFSDHPVVWDGHEVPWEVCDVALGFAKNMRGDAPMMDKWLASLLHARRYVQDQHATFLRGGDPPPICNGPSRLQRDRDRAALQRLEVPLVLVTPRRAPPSAKPGQVAQVYPPPT